MSGLLTAIRGHRKSFHADRNAKIASALRTGCESGSRMRVKIYQGPAPSMRAASSSSAGIVRKTGQRDHYTTVFQSHQAERALRICAGLIERVRHAQRIEHPIAIAFDEW